MSGTPEKYAGIIKRKTEDYRLLIKDDGANYMKIWQDFRQGLLPEESVRLLSASKTAKVYKINALGRDFIFKIDRGYPHHLDSKIWRILEGPFYFKRIKIINKAVNNGCRATADFFLVAVKKGGLISRESHIMMECLHGHILAEEKDILSFRNEIISVISELHRHRMALCDANPHNFFVTEQGLKTIDLSWRGAFRTGKAKDAIFLKKHYGIDFPLQSLSDKFLVFYMNTLFKARNALRRFRLAIKGKRARN